MVATWFKVINKVIYKNQVILLDTMVKWHNYVKQLPVYFIMKIVTCYILLAIIENKLIKNINLYLNIRFKIKILRY